MYLAIIILPLLGSIASGFFGRKIGVTGSQLITCIAVIITTIFAVFGFFEVGLNHATVSLKTFRWIDAEWLEIWWSFQFDSLTGSMLIPVLIISSLVHIYSIGYMSTDPHNQRFFSYLSLFTFMMVILVTGDNFLQMFVGWEGVGVCSYLLVCFWFSRIAANQSSLSAFLTNRVGDCFLTIGMFSIMWTFGNLDYATVFSLAPYINVKIVTLIGVCLLIGAMAKSSQIGLHMWLPMAMEGPTPVSALIHAATMVTAGVYLLMRSSPLIEFSAGVLMLCLGLGTITTVVSSLIGLFQQDIKKVIAYSTMSQLGMMVIAVGLSCYNIALFHLINHAFYKGLLFLGAGSVIHAVSDNQDFRRYGGLIFFLPLTYSVMLIASLSLVAFPFMTGFYSKDFILESAYGQLHFSSTVVYIIATIGAMFTTLYSIKVLYLTFLTNPNGPVINYKQAHEGDIFMSLPLIILAIFSIFFGFITKDIFIGLGSGFFGDNALFIHPSHEIMLDTEFGVPVLFKLLPLVFTILLSITSIFFSEYLSSVLIYFKLSRFGYNVFSFFNQRFLIELFYNKYITNFILKLGGQTTKVIDKGSIEFLGPYGLEKGLLNLSNNIAKLDNGVITSYALYILIGLVFYILLNIYVNGWIIILVIYTSFILIFNSTNSFKIVNYKDVSESRMNFSFKKIFSKRNIVKMIILFTIGFIGRYIINEYAQISVFTQYLHPLSLIFYSHIAIFIVCLESILERFNFENITFQNLLKVILHYRSADSKKLLASFFINDDDKVCVGEKSLDINEESKPDHVFNMNNDKGINTQGQSNTSNNNGSGGQNASSSSGPNSTSPGSSGLIDYLRPRNSPSSPLPRIIERPDTSSIEQNAAGNSSGSMDNSRGRTADNSRDRSASPFVGDSLIRRRSLGPVADSIEQNTAVNASSSNSVVNARSRSISPVLSDNQGIISSATQPNQIGQNTMDSSLFVCSDYAKEWLGSNPVRMDKPMKDFILHNLEYSPHAAYYLDGGFGTVNDFDRLEDLNRRDRAEVLRDDIFDLGSTLETSHPIIEDHVVGLYYNHSKVRNEGQLIPSLGFYNINTRNLKGLMHAELRSDVVNFISHIEESLNTYLETFPGQTSEMPEPTLFDYCGFDQTTPVSYDNLTDRQAAVYRLAEIIGTSPEDTLNKDTTMKNFLEILDGWANQTSQNEDISDSDSEDDDY